MAAAAAADEAARRAYAYALRLLARREYCTAEMRQRLARHGYPEAVINDTLTRLRSLDLLSESRFAEAFFRRRQQKGEAPWLTAQRARQRGVDESAVAAAQAKVEADYDAVSNCRRLLARRDPQGLRFRDERQWTRLARFLAGRGFDAATIIQAMKAQPLGEEQ